MKKADKIKYKLLAGSLTALAALPLPVLYGLSDFARFVLERVLKYRRKIVRANIDSSFPDKSEAERRKIESEFYKHLADVMVETIKLLCISDRELDRRVNVTNPEVIDRLASEGKSIILFLGHYCNWEWLQGIYRKYDHKIESFYVYKPLRSQVSDELFIKIRSRFDSQGLTQKSVIRTLLGLKHDHRNFIVGFIADQRSNSITHHTVEFLNHPTAVAVGGEALGEKVGASFLYADMEKTSRGHYSITFKPMVPNPDDTDVPYTRQFYRMLEESIRRQPPYWLWSHRRWLVYGGKDSTGELIGT